MAEEPIKVFYSWQSWTSSARNKEFIEDALKQALVQIEEVHGRQLIIDRDTKDLPGAPAIADAILEKIEKCDIFLADVSIVLKNEEHESPNPNVMLELGYAVKCLTWNQIILVMNKTFGSQESLPFDFQHRRWPLSYVLESGEQKTPVRKQLISELKVAIEAILHHGISVVRESITDTVERFIEQGETISLDKLIRTQIEQVYAKTSSDSFFEKRKKLLESEQIQTHNVWNILFDLYFHECKEELNVFLSMCWYGRSDQTRYVSSALKRWMGARTNDPQPNTSGRYVPSLFLTYLVGIAAVGNQNWAYLAAALTSNPTRNSYHTEVVDYSFEHIAENLVYYYLEDQERENSKVGNPIGKTMQEALQPLCERFLQSENEFNEAFDIFEFLLALHHLHARIDTDLSKVLLPQFADYHRPQKRSIDAIITFLTIGGKQGNNWDLLRTDLFNGKSERFLTVLARYQERIGKRNSIHNFAFGAPNYLSAYQNGLR